MAAGSPDLGNDPDGDFGELDAIEAIAAGPAPEIGDKVRIIAGRYRGATGLVESFPIVPTPSGSSIRVAYVRRPRAGITPVFIHEIERA